MNARITIIVAVTAPGNLVVADSTVAGLFPEYTRTLGQGRWEGAAEPVAVYTIFDKYSDGLKRHAELTAAALAKRLDEQAVLLHIELVTPPVLVGRDGVL